ncbi:MULTISPECIES: hypothetical protein [Bacillus]|nr:MULTISPECIES: hypothetical protein [Bacillus]MED1749279.1 hypothetical protein [Bacillus zhangzhouensis]
MTFRKKFVPVLLSATLLTSGFGTTTAFAAEPAKINTTSTYESV